MKVDLFSLAIALVNMIVVLELVRRRKMLENFALLWIAIAFGGFVLVLARPLVDRLSRFLGLGTGASFVFAGALLVVLLICMYLSLQVSRLATRVERLAEENAFLRGVIPPSSVGRDDADRADEH